MKTIENLAFKGGGVLGAAYAGVYRALEEVRLLGSDKTDPNSVTVYGNVQRVAGTSAGAIFATMVALGLTAKETETVLKNTDFTTFVDFDENFAEDGGFLQGAAFLNWMRSFVQDHFPTKVGPLTPDPTFGDLAAIIADPEKWNIPAGLLKDLHVFSRQVSPGRTVEFCAQSTPDVPISQAVRASMSIPFIFKPWTFPGDLAKRYPGPFFDGGTAFNYPVSAFDSGEANKKTLGFYLADMSSDQQDLFPELLAHIAMKELVNNGYLTPLEVSFLEALMEWLKQASQRNYYSPTSLADFDCGKLIAAGDANPDFAHAPQVRQMLTALSKAQKAMKKPGGKRADAIAVFKAMNLIDQGDCDFLTALDNWYGAICAVQNTPTNMVFDRDASRSIFVDTLGYQYFDFWLPECDTDNLIDSGYACTRQYLSFIMYS